MRSEGHHSRNYFPLVNILPAQHTQHPTHSTQHTNTAHQQIRQDSDFPFFSLFDRTGSMHWVVVSILHSFPPPSCRLAGVTKRGWAGFLAFVFLPSFLAWENFRGTSGRRLGWAACFAFGHGACAFLGVASLVCIRFLPMSWMYMDEYAVGIWW